MPSSQSLGFYLMEHWICILTTAASEVWDAFGILGKQSIKCITFALEHWPSCAFCSDHSCVRHHIVNDDNTAASQP